MYILLLKNHEEMKMSTINYSEFEKWKWKYGVPADFFAVQEKFIGKFIDAHKIAPLDQGFLRVKSKSSKAAIDSEAKAMIDIDYLIDPRGGKRTPHLHYKGEIYLLNSNQWKKFSGEVLQNFSEQLAKANSISFENFLELSETMGTLG